MHQNIKIYTINDLMFSWSNRCTKDVDDIYGQYTDKKKKHIMFDDGGAITLIDKDKIIAINWEDADETK